MGGPLEAANNGASGVCHEPAPACFFIGRSECFIMFFYPDGFLLTYSTVESKSKRDLYIKVIFTEIISFLNKIYWYINRFNILRINDKIKKEHLYCKEETRFDFDGEHVLIPICPLKI
jgi:hypothetical protein